MTSEAKPAWSSMTLQGAFVLFISFVLQLMGVDLGQGGPDLLGQALQAGIDLVGLALVIWGRIRAEKRIDISP